MPLSSHCSTGSRFRYAGLDVETSALEVRRPKTKKSYSLYVYLVYLDFAGFMRHERLLPAMLAAILQAYDKHTHTHLTHEDGKASVRDFDLNKHNSNQRINEPLSELKITFQMFLY